MSVHDDFAPHQHASLAVRMEDCLCYSKELTLDILERETDMAVRCEPDHCGLEALQEKQDHLEVGGRSRRMVGFWCKHLK